MEITPKQAPEMLLDILKAGLVPMLTSSPGLGKSAIINQLAKDKNLKVIDIRLAQCDPVDLNGFPTINKEQTIASYIPMNVFPLKNTPIPEGYKGWLILFDEFNSAPMSVQAAAYKIVLDKKIGQHDLNKKTAIVCAGNLASDKAIVNRLSTAMQSRLIHLELEINFKNWLDWANINNIDYRVIGWIGFSPNSLHKFDPNHNDKTFPCPRTWEFLSKIIFDWKTIPRNKLAIIAGTVGEGMANEFYGYCKLYKSLPTISQILQNPQDISISEEPSILYALSAMLSKYMTVSNITILSKMIERLPIEFQVISLANGIKRTPELAEATYIDEWATKHVQDLV